MLYRIVTGLHANMHDMQGATVAKHLRDALHIQTEAIRVFKIFTVDGIDQTMCQRLVDEGILFDPILSNAELGELAHGYPDPDFVIEVGFRPGVTDNEGRTAREAASLV